MKAARTDANHTLIAQAFRQCGASVHNTHRTGGGFPDMVVGIGGINLLVEVKTPAGRLNANERRFHDEWCGPIAIARTVEDARRLVELWREIGDRLRMETDQ